MEHSISCKEKMNRKNKVGAAFTDDGFAMGENSDTTVVLLCGILMLIKIQSTLVTSKSKVTL